MVDIVQGFQDPDADSRGLSWIQKDPSDEKPYQRNWTPHLPEGVTLASVIWVIHDNDWNVLQTWNGSIWSGSPPAGSLVGGTGAQAPDLSGDLATVWLLGGDVEVGKYLVTCRGTLSNTAKIDQSFQVRIIQR
jgi:hypothetical protein